MTDFKNKQTFLVFVGDVIVDFISYIDRLPKMGETFNSNKFKWGAGGKAANACIATSRFSSPCSIICKIGDDIFGKFYIDVLKQNNIKTDNVYVTTEGVTGTASVMVDKDGYNAIVVNSGTNFMLSIDDVKASENLIKESSVLVTNTMITLETAVYAMQVAKQYDVLTILNFAATSIDLDPSINKYIDILVANEIEAEAFSGVPVRNADEARNVVKLLLERDGLNVAVIVTLGEKGVVWGDKRTKKITYVPCEKVKVVDTTGAGDAFIGALAHYLFKHGVNALEQAIELASAYATISVQAPGTQVSYPYLADLDDKFKL